MVLTDTEYGHHVAHIPQSEFITEVTMAVEIWQLPVSNPAPIIHASEQHASAPSPF
uniref:Uncharacterized protein n=1 Tax=Arundo donax TaxID=35708 RepID=A0A0A8ZUU2_ARUDO